MILDKSYAEEEFIILRRCTHGVTYEELNAWAEEASTLIESFESLLSSLSDHFWSVVCYSNSFQKAFAASLNSLPTCVDNELFRIFYEWDENISKTACHLRTILLALYLRIAIYNEMDSDLGKKQWLEIMNQETILPQTLETSVWSHFPSNIDLFVKVVNQRFKITDWQGKRLQSFSRAIGEVNNKLGEHIDMIQSIFTESKDYKKYKYSCIIEEYLSTVVNQFHTLHTAFHVYRNSNREVCSLEDFVAGVAELVEIISCSIQLEDVYEIAMLQPNYPLTRIMNTIAQMEYEGTSLFYDVLKHLKSPDARYQLLQECIVNERFIFVLSKRFDMQSIMKDFPANYVQEYESLMEGVVMIQVETTLQKLEKQGILKNLGNLDALDLNQKNAIQELTEIFPDLSPPFIHLVLRHYDFSTVEALDAIIQKDQTFPMDLLAVESADLLRPHQNENALPYLSFKTLTNVSAAINCPEKTPAPSSSSMVGSNNMFKGLFSLAPSQPKKEETTTATSADTAASIAQAMEQLNLTLKRMKNKKFELQESSSATTSGSASETKPKEDTLVPMASSKKYGISRFKVTEEDRIATRPTYEQYKMETQDENEVYNDEYDDGYEGREFQVEPLNEDLPESDEEEEDEDGGENGSAPAAGGGSGVRGAGHSVRGNREWRKGQATGGDAPPVSSRPTNYTGGRDRQMKERHKNDHKKRGADRKRRGGMM